MRHTATRIISLILLSSLVAGCAKPAASTAAKGEDESVRQTFTALQAALKGKDADQVWDLLDTESQADAERAAKAVQEAYTKASPEAKAEQEKALGLPGAELGALAGKGFLKTKRFLGKYDEVSESKVEKVTVQGDTATVNYTEPDGDKEKLSLVRQGGRWKVSLPMPQATQP
jgi:hypothetical protein